MVAALVELESPRAVSWPQSCLWCLEKIFGSLRAERREGWALTPPQLPRIETLFTSNQTKKNSPSDKTSALFWLKITMFSFHLFWFLFILSWSCHSSRTPRLLFTINVRLPVLHLLWTQTVNAETDFIFWEWKFSYKTRLKWLFLHLFVLKRQIFCKDMNDYLFLSVQFSLFLHWCISLSSDELFGFFFKSLKQLLHILSTCRKNIHRSRICWRLSAKILMFTETFWFKSHQSDSPVLC